MEKEDNSRAVEELLNVGSEVAGGVAGAAAGLLVAGPAGAVAGGALGPAVTFTLRKIGSELKHRFLSHREEVRAGAALAYATRKVQENLDGGAKVRQDDFFEAKGARSTAEEITEGALVAAQRDHEEKKIPFYGNLLGNIPFHPELDRPTCNLLIRLAERLSYQQIVLIAVVANRGRFPLSDKTFAGRPVTPAQLTSLQELFDLYDMGLLNSSGEAVLDMGGLTPSKLQLQGVGAHLFNLMELGRLDSTDMRRVAAELT